eukprot:TRINITY_DN99_c0_g3_i3.p3 TRINITY_DN99_c0_g3~~TRINITY_DN99_c0_g3_i3.p3  ORF type:complete len:111 (-),score=14.35 TRINITY_DN99_c0_g3_i3:127-459(-)
MAEQGAKLKAKAAAEAIANRMVQEHRENVLQVGQQNGSGVSGGVVGQQFHHDYKDKLNTKRKFQVEPPPDERWNEEPLRQAVLPGLNPLKLRYDLTLPNEQVMQQKSGRK